ncbi:MULTISPECIES: Xaa-Pro peptidase family protein [unclassified Amycolatopsis]|uniref:M24 family metallopeptidase n=1 Tax=unclassified Amycolatopsis TaxID=2618356 RepID=UPI001C69A778|nr:Xaa-Pro peptidase family protein [Amycolatopsis sp. DSM 110486]QYN17404.1 Xaa-Pro peptidase family protein [Amycolatopsis sp. DSM 110486]
MPETHAHRRGALRSLITDSGVDALLVTDLLNIRYLTGFTGSNAALLVHAGGEAQTVFCTDGRYTTQSASEVPDLERVMGRASDRVLADFAARAHATYGRTGFESQHVSVEDHEALKVRFDKVALVRTPGLIEQLRAVKDEVEVAALRSACAAADRALADLLASGGLRAGRTELEVARDLENRMLEHGSSEPSFATIVAAGPNSAIPHHQPTGAQLREGDFVKLDFGATVDGYHSDMTRTFVLGKAADWQRELYDLVHRAQAAGTAAVFPGADVSEVDAAARSVIAAAGRADEFAHGLGHGVGLEVHEAPSLATTGVGTLSAGMAVTVEPGVYLAGRGGVRIEDTLVVRDSGPELLTLSTKDLVAV